MMTYLMLVGGFVLLFVGGEALVRGAVALARRLGVSPLVIGLTIVAAGTSAPELVVSLQAALRGQPDIAVGNVVGSNIANILLILGTAGLIQSMRASPGLVYRDGGIMVGASLLLVAVALTGQVAQWQGGIMFAGLIAYIVYSYWAEKRGTKPDFHSQEAEEFEAVPMKLPVAVLVLILGLGGVMLGADWLINGAVTIARQFGVSEAVIGLTVVAIGTSLPELATSVIAAFRRHADVAIGNVIGSNIFNILGILGVTALVTPVPVNPSIVAFDIWVMLGVSVLLLPLLVTGWRLARAEAALFFVAYVAYVGWLYLSG
ncbi:calcium/sodium antiporter [Telmatospirillum sp. J64-1]|uniref:calcium/sodium antiporter n=1 Tax=Telmatospirillum sp. J64-1 TaxID=2502183 RepID=UPI00115CE915|nr:calcium/sodium antiporter [Telmatospirillum sp. J64-1]